MKKCANFQILDSNVNQESPDFLGEDRGKSLESHSMPFDFK
jgi:hypothetical protein